MTSFGRTFPQPKFDYVISTSRNDDRNNLRSTNETWNNLNGRREQEIEVAVPTTACCILIFLDRDEQRIDIPSARPAKERTGSSPKEKAELL
jgi:hypothetical protein